MTRICGLSPHLRAAPLRLSHVLLPVTGSPPPLFLQNTLALYWFLLPMSPFSLAAYLLFLSALVSADPVHIPLTKRSPQQVDADYWIGKAHRARYRYNYTNATQVAASRRGVHGVLNRAGSTGGIQLIDEVSDDTTRVHWVISSLHRTRMLAIWGL